MRSARRASASRPEALRSTIAWTSSTSCRLTPGSSRQPGVDVARHGEVDQQQRPALAHAAITSSSSSRSIRWWGELVEETTMSARSSCAGSSSMRTARAAEALGQPDRPVVAAVGDEDGLDAAGGERAGGQLRGLAGADQQHPALGQVAEAALGELDGDRGDRDAALADRGLGPRALAGGQGAAEEAVQDRAGRALDQRELVGALHLALDLGLAEDHRVEARR